MPICGLRLKNLGPFDDIEFEFDEKVNVLVGPNNCGKTCALTAIADVSVYGFSFPKRFLREDEAEFKLLYARPSGRRGSLTGGIPWSGSPFTVGWRAWLAVVRGLGYTSFVPALRWSTEFRSKGPLAEDGKTGVRWTHQSAAKLLHELEERKDATLKLPSRAPHGASGASLSRDKDVIQTIVDLDYRAYREKKPELHGLIETIAAIASEITEGFPIRFIGVSEDGDGLFPKFKTPDGELPLNCLSQGTQSIIQWMAHLLFGYAEYYSFPHNLEDQPAIFIIDEIDAHLHPSWQRRIIPTLTKHFPNLQLFCSTHSPLMLAGLQAGQVQLLKRNEAGKVEVSRNETDIVGWSSDEVLRGFLDVPEPTDLQTSEHVRRLQELRRRKRLTKKQKDELEQLRNTVSEELLGGPLAAEAARLGELLTQGSEEPPRRPKTAARKKAKKATRRSKRTSAAKAE